MPHKLTIYIVQIFVVSDITLVVRSLKLGLFDEQLNWF